MVLLINIRKKIKQKIKEDNGKHLKIICNIFDDLKGQIEDIKKINQKRNKNFSNEYN